jgi:hypothetical protein
MQNFVDVMVHSVAMHRIFLDENFKLRQALSSREEQQVGGAPAAVADNRGY